MERVTGYIDGFNLYFGMKEQGLNDMLWLDPYALIENMLKPGQTLVGVHFFTSRISRTSNPSKERRQHTYLDALIARKNINLHFGQFQSQVETCRNCGNSYQYANEKMTDVNIATQMLTHAFTNTSDVAILVSADSDLVPPVRVIRKHFPTKQIVVAFPPQRYTKLVAETASSSFHIGRKMLRDAQLPATVIAANGFPLTRPVEWN